MNTSENDKYLNYVPSVVGYHQSIARYDYIQALDFARSALESAPCESEARIWADRIRELETKTSRGFERLKRALLGGCR